MVKAPEAFRTISEVAVDLDVPKHVLRFWEAKFTQVKPMKQGGGRRYYRPEDVALLKGIRHLLYSEGYTIRGVQKILRENGPRSVIERPEEEQAGSEAGGAMRTPQIPDVAADAAASQSMSAEESAAVMRDPQAGAFSGEEKAAFISALMSELDACKQILAEAKK